MSTRPEPQPFSTQPVSFVRRGNRLQGRRRDAWAELSEGLVVDVPRNTAADTSVDPAWEYDAAASFGRDAPLVVEVGSGLGEAVAAAATADPDRNFLALEVYKPGLAQTLLRIDQGGLTNVRIAQVNAAEALATMIRPASVAELWVFFPDPWHKTRHHKRRLVKDSFLALAGRVLAPGGILRLATDWSDYAVQMRASADDSPLFENLHDGERAGSDSPLTLVWASGVEHEVGGTPRREGREPAGTASRNEGEDSIGGWAPRFDGRILTSFENKAHDAGRSIFDLAYRRV
ncbi:tRNA (guanosine(46)-N7)-methyltransferase TrmB [Arthrobacter tumbae]|uniref:tRNA (guanosine(46)-N7)-methyltransferase TrmB n=1 Tax=Arthrobacter tumbae TaxID=163874 RepID=UPI001957C148|nr:tRNA (guanosine(46)-N7)-methyltransferase TrmB [Arthrobacter tumbae]MBM7780679.1 tRNA (guanine-N7-)-methyltransferase [Arthrobacter tumbae]